jgi:hypothetical protein
MPATPAIAAIKRIKDADDAPGYADIRNHGAVADGDEVSPTDNTAAFIAAATAAYAAGHRTVYVPPGVWGIESTLGTNFFQDDTAALTILGAEGIDSTHVALDNIAQGPVSEIRATNQQTLFALTGSTRRYSGTRFKNLRLNGNDPDHEGTGRGVWIHDHEGQIENLIFERVWIIDTGYEAIRHGNASDVAPRTSPDLHLLWRFKMRDCTISNTGRDGMALLNLSTQCEFQNVIMIWPHADYYALRVYGGVYTQLSILGGHTGNSVALPIGQGHKFEGAGGRYTYIGHSFEGWMGAAVHVDEASVMINFVECFWLDVVGGATQLVMRYDCGNEAYGIFFFECDFATTGGGWLNGNPIEHVSLPPPIFLYGFADRSLTSKWTGGATVTTIRRCAVSQFGTDMMQRFIRARIDGQPSFNLMKYDGTISARMWAEPAPNTHYTDLTPLSEAHANGDTVLTDAVGLAASGAAMYRRNGGTWEKVMLENRRTVVAASSLGTVIGKVAVLNPATGATTGYLPVYDAIT